jgi:small subunit ribosomal protein S20
MPESVDAAKRSLYKGGHGGGRNPAAAVLWAARRRAYLQSAFLRAAFCSGNGNLRDIRNNQQRRSCNQALGARICDWERTVTPLRIFEDMANTTSAKKATRKIARRTAINKSRRTQMRGAVRTVEDAIKRGDRDAALKAMVHAEPELMQAAQRNIIHKNNASRKVSRLTHQIAKLATWSDEHALRHWARIDH